MVVGINRLSGGSLGNLVVEIGADLNDFSKGLDKASKRIDLFSRKTGETLKSVGRGFTVFGAAVTGTMGVMVFQAGKLEEGITNTMTLIGGASDEMRQNLTDDVKEISAEYGLAKDQLTSSLFDIVSATGDAANATTLLEEASRLAIGGNSSLVESTAGLLTLMESYGDQLRDTADGADLLFKAQETARATVGELASAAGRFLPIARQLDINVDELFGTFSQLTVSLGNSNEAATALQGVLNGFLKPTKELTKLTDEWGFETSKAALDQLGFLGVLQKLNTVETERLGTLFPRIEGIKGLGAALQNLEKVEKNVIAIREREGAVNVALEKQRATFNQQLKEIRESITNLFISIGTNLLPVLKDLFDEIKPVVSQISQWVKENPTLTKTIVVLTAAVGALSLVFGPILIVMGQLVIIIGNLSPAMASLSVSAAALKTSLIGLSGVGIAAFSGWKLGRLIGEVTGLDEALSGPDGLFTRLIIRARELKAEIKEAVSVAFDTGQAGFTGGPQQESIQTGSPGFIIGGSPQGPEQDLGKITASGETQTPVPDSDLVEPEADNVVNIWTKMFEKIANVSKKFKGEEEERETTLADVRQTVAQQTFNTLSGIQKALGAESKAAAIIAKIQALGGAIVNTALGVTKALSLGPKGIPLAKIIGALGAVEIATIAATKFQKGSADVPVRGLTDPGEIVVPETFADAIRRGKLSLAGPGQEESRSPFRDGPSELRIDNIEINVEGNIDDNLIPELVERIGRETEESVRGALIRG